MVVVFRVVEVVGGGIGCVEGLGWVWCCLGVWVDWCVLL